MVEHEFLTTSEERALLRAANEAGVTTLAPQPVAAQALDRIEAAATEPHKPAGWSISEMLNKRPLATLGLGIGALFLLRRLRP